MSAIAERLSQDATDYFAAEGLSQSGMKDLEVSPLRYWHKHINPDRPFDEPTPEMQFGTALHCAVLEPDEFDKRYACELTADQFEDCLVTVDDIRAFIVSKGGTAKGTRKADLVAQAQAIDPNVPILDVLKARHDQLNVGKSVIKTADWLRVMRAAESLRDEPRVKQLLSEGRSEVSMFATDPISGTPIKARMDWVTPNLTLDLKTFSQRHGKTIDRSVADAILYERYYRQGWLYTRIRELNGQPNMPFVIAFVESTEPHEVRIKRLTPKSGAMANFYWELAATECHAFMWQYAECLKKFGTNPWRYAQEIEALTDGDMPGIAY